MNSILITIDALRPDHLGEYGYHRETLPSTRRLTSGVRYDAAFASGTNSRTSIPSFLTGHHAVGDLLEDATSIASPLCDTGVATGAFHSNVLLASQFGRPAGFDRWEDFDIGDGGVASDSQLPSLPERIYERARELARPIAGGSDAVRWIHDRIVPSRFSHPITPYVDATATVKRATDWIESVDEPFFAWIHLMDPHRPYGLGLTERAYVDESVSKDRIVRLMATAGRQPDQITSDDRRLMIDLYDSEIRTVDAALETLYSFLQSSGYWEETSVLVSADHGEEFGDHGRYFHRNLPYDELIQVPLYVKPAASVGESLLDPDMLASLLDLGPTLCDLHGVDPPTGFQGESLISGAVRDSVTAIGDPRDEGSTVAVRTHSWKLIRCSDDSMLYFDLANDPDETELVEDVPDDTRRALERQCPHRPGDLPEETVTANEEVVKNRLESLGYLE